MKYENSLRAQILEAPSKGAIDRLLKKGTNYQHASARTKRRWQEAAAKRRGEL
mgnify:CR=1 FL=1|tara:strand:+ start:1813 stop:1971 length:159 start_codon:yes stop_codon:yes gene_type:complete